MRTRDAALTTLGALAAGHLVPTVAAIGPLRARVRPALRHVALTFDDGPDPGSTPAVLDELDALGLRATFFVLGSRLVDHPALGRELAARGHEVAVHGWTHRPQLLQTPRAAARDLARAAAAVRAITGRAPRYWRPPHGIPTGAGLLAARRLGMRAVLWDCDGRDWRADATAASIAARCAARLRAGTVVLLHDSDAYSAPGSWRRVVAALPDIAGRCAHNGWTLGPLGAAAEGPRHALR